jgi:hypothetical protein
MLTYGREASTQEYWRRKGDRRIETGGVRIFPGLKRQGIRYNGSM